MVRCCLSSCPGNQFCPLKITSCPSRNLQDIADSTSPQCNSWYKSDGKITALWPGSTLHYIEALREIRFEDWEIAYEKGVNRYDYLGNGHSQTELDPSADTAYYIRETDDGPPLTTAGKRKLLTNFNRKSPIGPAFIVTAPVGSQKRKGPIIGL